MKIICIENNLEVHPDAPNEMVCVGKIYTIKEVVNWYGMEWYILKEMKYDWGWNPKCFMPISDFDERLMVLLRTKPLRKKIKV